MKISTGIGFAVVGIIFMFWLHCSPVSSDPSSGEGAALLRLSLEEIGRTSAEFSGAPIEAIIELDADTGFGFLNWHTGQGEPLYPDTIFSMKAKRFSLPLFWMKYPLYKDSIDSSYYDTVWVSMGGGLKKSNKVRVRVTNLPVVVDSARFDSLFLLGQDTMWQCSLPVVLKTSYKLLFYARDLDKKVPEIRVLGNKGKIILNQTKPLDMEYQPPAGDFIDTIRIVAFDQMRGQAIRTLILNHITPNILPFIDSVQVKTTMLKGSSIAGGVYRVGFTAFDTLRLRCFAHDSSGTIRKTAWSTGENILKIDSTNSMRATYICSTKTCRDTLTDSSVVVDTITIKVFDDRGDSTVRRIELSRGEINQPPYVKSLLLDEKGVDFSDTTGTVTTVGGVAHLLKLDAADPEKKTLTVNWTGSPSSRFSQKTDSTIRYSAPPVNDTDTVSVTISDSLLTIRRTIRIIVDDILPVFDSIVVEDTVFKGTDTVFAMVVEPRDTLLFSAYARDRDSSTDSMTYLWTAGKQELFKVRLGNRARYVLPDSALKDTIILTLQDGTAQSVREIILNPVNRAPVLDSILGDSTRLIMTGGNYHDTIVAADTISYEVFARDPEGGDLTYTWNASDTTRLSSKDKMSIDYFCSDRSYLDTISVIVKDEGGVSVMKKVIIQIDTVTTP